MKNALLTALTLIGLSAFTPRAEAGGWFRASDRYDRCERPVYVPSRSCDRYSAPTYSRTYRPTYHYSYRPSAYSRDYCDSSRRGYSSTPRFSIRFGF
jgi:hypothetical protein